MKRPLALAGLLACLACGPSSEPGSATEPATPPTVEAEAALAEAAPAEAAPPEVAPEPAEPTLAEGVELTYGYVIQVATKKALADAKQAHSSLKADDRPFILRGPKYWWVMAGSYASYSDAELALPLIKAYVGEGGLIRELPGFCPGRRMLEPGMYECVDIPRPDLEVQPALAEDEALAAGPAVPEPPAIIHPPASVVMVVASNRVFTPGETSVDIAPKYRTFLWTPSLGPLPAKGAAAAAVVEVHEGLVMSDGAQLWDLAITPTKYDYPKCNCAAVTAEREDIIGKGTVSKTFNELIATGRSDRLDGRGAAPGRPRPARGVPQVPQRQGRPALADAVRRAELSHRVRRRDLDRRLLHRAGHHRIPAFVLAHAAGRRARAARVRVARVLELEADRLVAQDLI